MSNYAPYSLNAPDAPFNAPAFAQRNHGVKWEGPDGREYDVSWDSSMEAVVLEDAITGELTYANELMSEAEEMRLVGELAL